MKIFIISTTLLGLLPFYIEHFSLIFNISSFEFEKIQVAYGAIIISFLSGMQMERYIIKYGLSVFNLSLPLLNTLWGWSYNFNKVISESNIIIIGLIFSLLIDLFLQKKFLDKWFIKLRFYVTTLAVISFII
jgi:hypothetical protein